MALTNNHHYAPFDKVDFQTYDYPIGGKLLVVSASFSEDFMPMLMTDVEAKDLVKNRLASELAMGMLSKNLLEFTQQQDPYSFAAKVYCRAYLAPNDQVKILRLSKKV